MGVLQLPQSEQTWASSTLQLHAIIITGNKVLRDYNAGHIKSHSAV